MALSEADHDPRMALMVRLRMRALRRYVDYPTDLNRIAYVQAHRQWRAAAEALQRVQPGAPRAAEEAA